MFLSHSSVIRCSVDFMFKYHVEKIYRRYQNDKHLHDLNLNYFVSVYLKRIVRAEYDTFYSQFEKK